MTTEPIPASIVMAICAVQAGMDAVKRDQRNQHGNYQFASTDAIYAELTRRLAGAGLVIMCLEDEPPRIERVEKDGKTAQWMRVTFAFVLATKDASWTHPGSRRTLYIQVTGPQTFMAAQSYAEKSFLRSLFKLPTGDMDLDSAMQAETEEAQTAFAAGGKRKSSAASKRDGTAEKFKEIEAQIKQAPNMEVLRQIPDLWAAEIAGMPEKWTAYLEGEIETRAAALGGMNGP